jgi:serine/threonine-protein kinase
VKITESLPPAPPPAGPTEADRQGPAARVPMVLAGGSDLLPEEEVRALLRKRMKVLGLIGLCMVVVAMAVTLPAALGSGYWQLIAIYSLCLVLAASVTGLVWGRRPLSLAALRAVEAAVLVVCVALLLWYVLDRNLRGRDAGVMATLGQSVFEMPLPPRSDQSAAPQRWRIELGDFAMHYFGAHYNLFWIFLIFSYALFIPNSWRRCAAVVGALALLAVLTNGFLAWSDAAVRGRMLAVLFWQSASWVGFATALAIFGSYRIESLRREAVQARRLGQYRLKGLLGAGGMGEVHLAEHVLLRRPCAIKLIRPERVGDPRNLARFEREVQATATLTNWHTVEIFDYGRAADGTFYYVMEYLPGLNLEQLVRGHGPVPPERAVHLLRQVCAALREAHARGLIHRDIKPSNVITCRRGGREDVAKLLDFGLVLAPGAQGDWEKLTQEGALAGTPSFMSPEQAGGSGPLDARSDVYSLGAVAFFLLTGRPPFTGKTAVQVLAAHLHQPPPPLRDLCPDVPPGLEAVVARCLAKAPGERFPDVQSLEQALARLPCAEGWTDERAAAWWERSGSPLAGP